ncbi:tRNA pseudouridine(38-40) synthase TruA [Lancefieldella parvula]|uniref:tRNA pseudouridine(38-40) synthase TruA n=1 Tax=Lancefieldella parvula TaxID=1382 RepID=UPI0028800A4F|nr:tRNA pseudouridine(38-40) synthase TruA [Lancefieldella parvula]MDU4868516.1 tRNA pseudouridine(38-40) synthase TruA [Lancefieldella parvula]
MNSVTSQNNILSCSVDAYEESLAEPSAAEDLTESEATLVIKLGYRGAAFCGFAEQPAQRSVAGDLRRALETVLRREVELTCAGRTDAGVHAQAQYVSLPIYDADLSLSGEKLVRSLTALTDDDISIRQLFRASQGFSARFDAQARSYRYRICADSARPILGWDHVWWYNGHLDADLMDKAAQALVGEHDFKSFCKAISAEGKPTHRFVERLSVEEIEEAGEKLIAVDITGNAFLHNMVRTIVGTLVEIGRGHRPVEWIDEVLAAKNRIAAGSCAPAQGLTFVNVCYPEGILQPW